MTLIFLCITMCCVIQEQSISISSYDQLPKLPKVICQEWLYTTHTHAYTHSNYACSTSEQNTHSTISCSLTTMKSTIMSDGCNRVGEALVLLSGMLSPTCGLQITGFGETLYLSFSAPCLNFTMAWSNLIFMAPKKDWTLTIPSISMDAFRSDGLSSLEEFLQCPVIIKRWSLLSYKTENEFNMRNGENSKKIKRVHTILLTRAVH